MSDFISGLVLAAGTSSRLGKQPKQFLPGNVNTWEDYTRLCSDLAS